MNIITAKFLLLMTPGLAATALPAAIVAETLPGRGPIPFSVFDRDADGFVSEQEFNLTRGERMAQRSAAGRRLRNAANAPSFQSFDRDGDGRLTLQELNAGHRIRMQHRHGTAQDMSYPVSRRNPVAPEFTEVDTNGNGNIEFAEFLAVRERITHRDAVADNDRLAEFTAIDANRNDVIDPGEFRSHRLQHRADPRQGK